MSLYSLNIKPKCYKVACNLLDPEVEYPYESIDTGFDINNYESKLEEIINHYTCPVNAKQMIFLFVGEITSDIKDILDNITNYTDYNTMSSDNKSTLSKFFGYNIDEEWNILSNESVKMIYFVPYLIHDFDNIAYLHRLISSVISSFTKDNEIFYRQFVNPPEIFMYTDEVIRKEEQFENFKKKIIMNQKNKHLNFNTEIIENKLSQIGIPKSIIVALLSKYNNDVSRLIEILSDPLMKKLYIIYKNFIPLTLAVKHRRDNIFNSTNVLDKIYGNVTDISDSSYKIENALFENQLRNITDSDIIYLYTQINLTNFISNKFGSDKLNDFYGKLYKYYFYKTEKTSIKTIISKNTYSNYKDIISNYYNLDYHRRTLDTFNLFTENDGNESLSNIDIQPYIINIKTYLNFPINYNFLELFNNVNLSSDIPFTKFRDTVANDIVFKIYKPITYSEGQGHLPEVSIDQLNNWIKYKGFELDNFRIKPIKSNPREVFFKIKIDSLYTNNILYGIVDKIFSDETGNITYNIKSGVDILTGIDKNFANVTTKDEDISEITEGTEVKFNEKKTIYADLEIYRRGIVNVSINTQQFENSDSYELEIIINKVFRSINQFINTIFEEDRLLVQYQQFKINFEKDDYFNNNIHSLSEYSENNITIDNSMLVSIENRYKLNWYNIYELLEFLNSVIDIPEEKFEKGDDIIYQDQEGIALDTFDAKIKNINIEDNTYTITYSEDDKLVTKENIKSRFLSLKNNYDKSLVVFYFRTNKGLDYDRSNKIFKFIDKSRIVGYNTKEISDRLKENFAEDVKTPEEAQIKIQEFLDATGLNMRTFNTYTETNPQITINLGSSKKLDNEFFETEIYVENIPDYYTYKQIQKFMAFLYESYNYKFHNDQETSVIIKNLMDSTESLSEDQIKDSKKAIKVDVTADTRIGANIYEVSENTLGIDFEDSDIEDDEIEDEDSTLVNNEEDLKQAFKNDSMIIGQSRLSKNTILDNLYNKAPKLFYWENKENPRKTYTGICQGVKRYPKILSEEQKHAIDMRDSKYFKGELSNQEVNGKNFNQVIEDIEGYQRENKNSRSYSTTLSDIDDCETKKDLNTSRKCSAVKYGTEVNKNWFICPKIYDIKENVPLHWTMLDYIKLEGKTFIPSNYNDINLWRTDKNTGKDIIEYKPTFKGRGVVNTKSNKVAATAKNSLVLIDKGSQYSYPGFLTKSSNPNGFFPPCCYNSNMRINQAFDPKSITSKTGRPNTYIQGQYKELGYNPLRYGILPDELSKILNNNNSICTTGELSDKKKCFFRVGNQQGNNSFLTLMSDMFFNEINISYVKDFIVENITEEQFKTLNGGSLEIKFRNYGKQSSFQNFLEYTLSDEYKDYTLYYEFFTYYTEGLKKNSKLSREINRKFKDIKPNVDKPNIFHLIFNTVYTKNDKGIPVRKYELLCPHFMKNLYHNYNQVEFFTISIKNKDSFEPVYYLNGSTKTTKIFSTKMFKNYSEDPEIYAINAKLILHNLINKCKTEMESDIVQVARHIGGLNSQILSKVNYRMIDIFMFYFTIVEQYPKYITKIKYYMPTNLLIDDYNRVYGIRLKNKAIIPIYPDIIDTNLIEAFNSNFIKYYVVEIDGEMNIVSKYDINVKNPEKNSEVIIEQSSKTGKITKIKGFKFNISYKYNYNIDYEKTNLKTHTESYDFIRNNSSKLREKPRNKDKIKEIDIKPIYYFTDNQEKITGFIANTGSYINVIASPQTVHISKSIKNNYYDIDRELIEYQKLIFNNIYKEPAKLSEIIELTDKISSDTKDELFNFKTIFVDELNLIVGILTDKNIFIPVQSEVLDSYQKFIQDSKINITSEKMSINSSQTTIEGYLLLVKEMSNILDNIVPMKISGFKMNNTKKCINGIILETGFIIELDANLVFRINLKSESEGNDFKINTLLNNIFIDSANQYLSKIKPKNLKDKILSEFNYSLLSYRVSKYMIFKLLQNSNYRFLREFIKKTVYSIEINNFVKKLILIPIISIIFKLTMIVVDKKPDVYPNISIDNVGNLDKCIGRYIEKTSNNWVSNIKSIKNASEYVHLSLSIIFGRIDDKNIQKIKNIIGFESYDESKDLVSNIIYKISSNDIEHINNNVIKVYNNIPEIIPSETCKLKIFKISQFTSSNLIRIIDELIQNNYSKIEILDSFKVLSGNERYKFNKTNEIFLSNKELDNKNKLLELYDNVKKLYYRKIMDFDDIKLSAKISETTDSDMRDSKSKDICLVHKADKQYISIKVGDKKRLKNNSKFNTRKKTLTVKEMAYIFRLNTELTSCNSISGGTKDFNITDVKKRLLYQPR